MIYNVFSIGSWQEYGVDFTGGSLIQVQFHQPATAAQLRAALGGPQAPPITRFGEENEFTIRAPLGDEDVETIRVGIQNQLQTAFGDDEFTILRTETVGPKIGAELERNAALAILFSFALTLIYVAFRFELRFGLAAVIATAHDILITLGFLAIFRVEIALPTVAAILTIVGYSLNDTIVVFDRVRGESQRQGRPAGRSERTREPLDQRDTSSDGAHIRDDACGPVRSPGRGWCSDPRLYGGADPGRRDRDVFFHLRGVAGPARDPEAVRRWYCEPRAAKEARGPRDRVT